jgi:hypothetical protein
MNIKNDIITFDESDFDGLSDFARKSITSRIGSVADFAVEAGLIFSRSLAADKSALRRSIVESPEVQALAEKLALADDQTRADTIAEAAAKI